VPIDQERLEAGRCCPGNVLRKAVADVEDVRWREAQVSGCMLEDDRRWFGEPNLAGDDDGLKVAFEPELFEQLAQTFVQLEMTASCTSSDASASSAGRTSS